MTTDDKKIIVNRNEILNAWEEADDATVAETEARKEYQRLHLVAEEKRRHFRCLIDYAQEYEEGEAKNEQEANKGHD